MPSMQAPASPRRPMRRTQRTRLSVSPILRATAAVPSGELSSTNTTSQSTPASVRASFSTSSGTLSRSLKVGTTIVIPAPAVPPRPCPGAEARPLGSPAIPRLSSAVTSLRAPCHPHCCSVRRRRLLALASPGKRSGIVWLCLAWPAGLCFGEIRCPRPGAIHLNELNQDPLHSRSALSSPDGASSRKTTRASSSPARLAVSPRCGCSTTPSRWRRWTCAGMPARRRCGRSILPSATSTRR